MASALTDFAPLENALREAGFAAVGVVDFDLAEPIFKGHADRYADWISRGFHGDMGYLERGRDRRLNPRLVFPEVQSVITVALPYDARPIEQDGVRYARYLNGPDYHEDLKQRIRSALTKFPELNHKICIDTSAVLERTWAAITGLGWIGKNTMLINPQFGSFFFIGTILTDVKFGRGPRMLKDYCGNCERCIESCPTQAFTGPHDLDSRRCISYLTLEKRGEWPVGHGADTGGYVAGCDRCQEVCPYNTKPVKYAEEARGVFTVHTTLHTPLKALLEETKEQYKERVKNSALSRIKYEDFQRNLKAAIEPKQN
ncbi:MAG: tRNA epoxyqueuosine(34) reductase QueG [Bdellovibrionales bacterium]|nr:tRNA epoxyqueuosine(34) reductase QueG [Bdellovibrionales bacterium]